MRVLTVARQPACPADAGASVCKSDRDCAQSNDSMECGECVSTTEPHLPTQYCVRTYTQACLPSANRCCCCCCCRPKTAYLRVRSRTFTAVFSVCARVHGI